MYFLGGSDVAHRPVAGDAESPVCSTAVTRRKQRGITDPVE